jgi:hypothetical protein
MPSILVVVVAVGVAGKRKTEELFRVELVRFARVYGRRELGGV